MVIAGCIGKAIFKYRLSNRRAIQFHFHGNRIVLHRRLLTRLFILFEEKELWTLNWNASTQQSFSFNFYKGKLKHKTSRFNLFGSFVAFGGVILLRSQ